MFGNNNPINNNINDNSAPIMKQIFKNNDITILSSLLKTNNNTVINGSFYVSNNLNKLIQNVKISFMVPKHITLKVINTTGASLDPLQSLGVRKVKF